MTYTDDQLIAISGLQHLAFCERQCVLIHMERMWTENVLTAQGRLMHERVHSDESETRGDRRLVRSLPLRSYRLGLVGVADVVEFQRVAEDESADGGIRLPGRRGIWRVYPVEYKRGRPKSGNMDTVQLCAQAMCLEEMMNISIDEGSLYYGQTHCRVVVSLDVSLREQTETLTFRFHGLMGAGEIPPPKFGPHCRSCSLEENCMPRVSGSASSYIERMIMESMN